MCFSAIAFQDMLRLGKDFDALVDSEAFARLYAQRLRSGGLKTPKAMDDAAIRMGGEVASLVLEGRLQQASEFEQKLFKQSKRLADAERKLKVKGTKTALNEQRIATNEIEKLKVRIADLKRTEVKERDSRIFPGGYSCVVAVEGGKRIIRPMRYLCRPAGKPALYDERYPGIYNARRDNLEGFWKGQFGSTHALMVATKFYENVPREDGNHVLEYVPRTSEDMLIACLWSHWTDPKGKEADLDSFAAITDEPEPEVAASGHDRTIINIKPEYVDAWLDPQGDRTAMQAIFDDKRHPYYEHRKAA